MAIAVIGPIAKDRIVIGKSEKEQIGGTVFYAGSALAKLGIKTQIFAKLSAKDKNLLGALKHKNISLFPYFCEHTTSFRNVYHGENREQFVDGVAEPFEISDITSLKANIVHLGPLTKPDIPLAVFKHLKSLGIAISLDIQGFTRKINGRKVVQSRWKDAKDFLRYVDILKADANEAELMGGIKKLAGMGPIEVVITNGQKGSVVYSKKQKKLCKIPAFEPSAVKDVTGAGDTYIAGYLAKRIGTDDIEECGLFGAMCATMKIENGFFNAAKKDVEKRLKDS
ncbi:MAG: ribokinase [Candidatus Aenigmarchaeota archaeon]|nr:ribokinase [Candidatus Aenigmarchaeota archaeon]